LTKRRGLTGHAETTGLSQQPGLIEYVNPKQGYRIDRPSSWEQTSKAGADVLFADPAKKSTTIGVTVSPIKIAGLEEFGDVETVRKKLMNTEKQKVPEQLCTSLQTRLAPSSCTIWNPGALMQESTKDVTLVQESSRKGKSGTLIYDIEYELDSTRGRKRILSSVGIAQKKLFIVNGNLKCDASGCTDSDGKDIAVLRQVASTFDVIWGSYSFAFTLVTGLEYQAAWILATTCDVMLCNVCTTLA